jgi:hypothetical protein
MTIESEARNIKPTGLRKCLEEIFEWYNTGVLVSGLLRDFANDVIYKITNDHFTKLKIAEDTLLREAARRYLEGED